MATYRGAGDPNTGTTVTQEAADAAASAAAALVSENNASTSETNAATSETNAATSASNASTSETNAATSETNAAASETNAAASEAAAAASEANLAALETAIDTTADATAITIDASENVGIGGTPTASRLLVEQATNTPLQTKNTGSTGSYHQLINTGGSAYVGSVNDDLVLAVTGSATTALTLDSSLNATFGGHVRLSSAYNINWGGAYGANIPTIAGTSGAGAKLEFYGAGSTSDVSMTLDDSGNVGIGVTPEAWAASITALQVGGTGSVSSTTAAAASASISLTQNAYNDGAWKYQVTDEASNYLQAGGYHYFRTTASGTADTAITWTNALILDNSANATFAGNVTFDNDANFYATTIGASPGFYFDSTDYLAYVRGSDQFLFVSGATTSLSLTPTNAVFSGNVSLADNQSLRLGNGYDLSLIHNGSSSFVQNNYNGSFYVRQNGDGYLTIFDNANSVGTLKTCMQLGGATPYVRLYYDGTKKLETTNTGILANGNVSVSADAYSLYLGASDDLQIRHETTFSHITNNTGNLYIREYVNSGGTVITAYNSVGSEKVCAQFGGSTPHADLYYDGGIKLSTITSGVELGTFSATGATEGVQIKTSAKVNTSVSTTSSSTHQRYYNPNGQVGGIATSGASTAFNTTSDKTKKKSFGLVNDPFSVLDNIEIHDAAFLTDLDNRKMMIMAQDVEPHYPQAITHEGDNWSADYSQFSPLALACIKDLNDRLKQLEAR